MNRHSGLFTRLRRLEAQRKTRKLLPAIIMGVYPEEQPGPIVGIEANGKLVRLKEGETIRQLQARAAAEIPARFLTMRYSAASGPRSAVPAPAHAPAPVAPVDPFARAGIGREASREELVRMGAIGVPAERLV